MVIREGGVMSGKEESEGNRQWRALAVTCRVMGT